jgi:hypothetical protein
MPAERIGMRDAREITRLKFSCVYRGAARKDAFFNGRRRNPASPSPHLCCAADGDEFNQLRETDGPP